MDRRRLLRSAAIALALVTVLAVVVRCSTAPTQPDEQAAADADGSTSSRSDPPDPLVDASAPDYPRTREGAVAAATAYSLALDGPRIFDPAHRRQILRDVATEDARTELEGAFADGVGLIASQLGLEADTFDEPSTVWRAVPGGWQLLDYDRAVATVAIWAAVVAIAEDQLLIEPAWQTTEMTVVWERGGWRLAGFTSRPGPDPAFVGAPDGDPVAARINAFAPYRHWPQPSSAETLR
jgi:hypothetical protein